MDLMDERAEQILKIPIIRVPYTKWDYRTRINRIRMDLCRHRRERSPLPDRLFIGRKNANRSAAGGRVFFFRTRVGVVKLLVL